MSTCPSCTTDLELDAAYCGHCGRRVRARRSTLVGTVLDARYRVDAKLAEGGFGVVYRATHLAHGHEVALKVLHADLAIDASLSARFRREGATLASLRNAHTVATYELGETPDGTLYIAMELLRGESLLDRFRARGPLPWRSVLEIVRAVCRSLAEAHGLGIVHRDLKPANIHLEPAGHGDGRHTEPGDFVKVLDFGIAKLMRGSTSDDGAEITRIGQAVGTLEYMAPEQIIGSACDGRSDIFALGLVMYEMLTGQRPFSDATGPTSLITALMTRTVTPPSAVRDDLSPAVDALVLRCLEREPADRFATVHELGAAIEAALAMPTTRGSWAAVPAEPDDEPTQVDVQLPLPIPTPVPGAQLRGDLAVAYDATVMQYALAPSETILGPAPRLREPTPFALAVAGSRVVPMPQAPHVLPVQILAPAAAPAPVRRWSVPRVLAWAVGLLVVGAGVGMTVAVYAG